MFLSDAFVLSQEGGAQVVSLTVNELNEENVSALGEGLDRVAAQCATLPIHLDLAQVNYLSSAAIGKVVGLYRKLKNQGGKLVLTNVAPFPFQVLQVTGVDRLVEIRPQEVGP